MSKCVVHMKKHKMQAIGGMQSHNQREHKSNTNKEIDYKKSASNFDTINNYDINYTKAIKKRISELNLPKAVRSDAVVYCSFIITSDREFFYSLGEKEHLRRQYEIESIAIGLSEPTPFEYVDEEYKTDCITNGSKEFFRMSTRFFVDKYGCENIINATVHFDETTPHMHLGIVPVTDDGRLCAKDIFTKINLQNLQGEFADIVGEEFMLERGKMGSKAKHLDEIDYKIKVRKEQLEQLDSEVGTKNSMLYETTKQTATLSVKLDDIKSDIDTLTSQRLSLEQHNLIVEKAIKKKIDISNFSMDEISQQIQEVKQNEEMKKRLNLLEKFINHPHIKPLFDRFCQAISMKQKNEEHEKR